MALYILTAVLAAAVFALLVLVLHLRQQKRSLTAQNASLTEQNTSLATQNADLARSLRTAEDSLLRAQSQAEAEARAAERTEEFLKSQFKNLATDVLGEQSRAFRQLNRDELDKLLKPFKDNIVDFRQRVEHIYSFENEQRGALRNELETLMKLNRRITDETANLTRALKGDSKVQGDAGEMLLETLLESSNLVRGIHYDSQYNIKDEQGNNLRPDVVVRLPEGKRIVIDSKMSLTAYMDYLAAQSPEDSAKALEAHIASVRRHVRELSAKEYQRLLESPDFVIMFVPSEAAFLTALQNDSAIWSDAYAHKVIVSSPTNLFALLKLVDDLWKRNEQSKNTADIVNFGTKLYDQLVAFTSSLEGVGTALDRARASYDDAYKRLCTGNDNIVRTGERLRKLGLPAKRRQSAQALAASGALDDDPASENEGNEGENS